MSSQKKYPIDFIDSIDSRASEHAWWEGHIRIGESVCTLLYHIFLGYLDIWYLATRRHILGMSNKKKFHTDTYLGLSENRVPLNLLVSHHSPYWPFGVTATCWRSYDTPFWPSPWPWKFLSPPWKVISHSRLDDGVILWGDESGNLTVDSNF